MLQDFLTTQHDSGEISPINMDVSWFLSAGRQKIIIRRRTFCWFMLPTRCFTLGSNPWHDWQMLPESAALRRFRTLCEINIAQESWWLEYRMVNTEHKLLGLHRVRCYVNFMGGRRKTFIWQQVWGPTVWWALLTCTCPGISQAMWRRCGLTAVPSMGAIWFCAGSRVAPRNAAHCCVNIGRAVTKPAACLQWLSEEVSNA